MKEKVQALLKEKKTYYIGGAVLGCLVLLLLLVVLPSTKAEVAGNFPDQKVGNLAFQNGKLNIDGENSNYTVDVVNEGGNQSLNLIEIHFKDNDQNELATLYGYIGSSINQKEKKTITTGVDMNLSKATTVEYIIK